MLTLSFSEMHAVLYHGLMWVRNPREVTLLNNWARAKRHHREEGQTIWKKRK